MQPKFIDHIVLIVKDVEETEKFYISFLGKPIYQDKKNVTYKIGDTDIYFTAPDGKYEKIDKDKGGLNHLAFGLRTLDELKEVGKILNEANIKNSEIKIDKYGDKEFIWFDDPNGIRLEFYYRPVESN